MYHKAAWIEHPMGIELTRVGLLFYLANHYTTRGAPLPSVKCSAWVAISKDGIIGPYWFEDENERAQTVNKERYVAVLRKVWASLRRRRGTDRDDQWFQQDVTTPNTHTHTHQITHLTGWERFQERLISRKCDVEWAPHSPALNPPDFYLWGYLKDHVYQNNPQTIGELKAAIAAKIREIPWEECMRVIDNFAQRLQVCL